MEICVAGLGIIGGSLCLALKRAGYSVAGWNRSQKPINYALENDIIDESATDFKKYDAVFVALPPKAAVKFLNENEFKDGAVVADICGVKGYLEKEIYKKPRNFRYLGTHPMAGKEVSGVENACADLFDGASIIIVNNQNSDIYAVQLITELAAEMGFKKIIECSSDEHDRKIAYTSQLAHVVSNAYVKNEEIKGCLGFTGGSFQDMTRIAGVDENVWTELYLLNKKNLSLQIASLISSLEDIKSALDDGDEEELKRVLKDGRTVFEENKG